MLLTDRGNLLQMLVRVHRHTSAKVRLQFYTNITPTWLSWKQGAWVRRWSWVWWGSQRQVWELEESRELQVKKYVKPSIL